MAKSWATFCCSGTYKKILTKVLRNLGNNRRNLILSVYKIQLEAEPDQKVYEEKLTVYRKLLKA